MFRKRLFIIVTLFMIAFSICSCDSYNEKVNSLYEDSQNNSQDDNFDDNYDNLFEDNFGDLFRFGLVMVKRDGKYGFINKDNEYVIESLPTWDNANDCGLFWYYPVIQMPCDGGQAYYDITGNLLIDTDKYRSYGESSLYGMLTIMDKETRKIGYTDIYGNVVIEPQFDEDTWYPFANCGLSAVAVDGEWGYIDITGTFVIEPQFRFATNFCAEGIAIVSYGTEEWVQVSDGGYVFTNTKKYALINTDGELITDFIFDKIDTRYDGEPIYFVNGIGVAKLDGQYVLIDTSGNVIESRSDYHTLRNLIEESYEYVKFYVTSETGTLCGLKDKHENIIIEPDYDSIWVYSNHFIAQKNGYYGLLDYNGNILINFQYADLEVFDDDYVIAVIDSDGDYNTKNDRKYGILDLNGDIVIPFEYDEIRG